VEKVTCTSSRAQATCVYLGVSDTATRAESSPAQVFSPQRHEISDTRMKFAAIVQAHSQSYGTNRSDEDLAVGVPTPVVLSQPTAVAGKLGPN
jgi:hypothetical protein